MTETPGSQAAHHLGFIGAGQMALALARGFVRAGLAAPERLVAYDVSSASLERFVAEVAGAQGARSNEEVTQRSDVVFIAVKPQHLAAALSGVRSAVADDKLFVSIVAGAPLARQRSPPAPGWGIRAATTSRAARGCAAPTPCASRRDRARSERLARSAPSANQGCSAPGRPAPALVRASRAIRA